MKKYTLGQIINDETLSQDLGLKIPSIDGLSRREATKAIMQFQTKKAFAISALNKNLRASGLQLTQKSYFSYKVISVSDKAKIVARLAKTMNNAALSY